MSTIIFSHYFFRLTHYLILVSVMIAVLLSLNKFLDELELITKDIWATFDFIRIIPLIIPQVLAQFSPFATYIASVICLLEIRKRQEFLLLNCAGIDSFSGAYPLVVATLFYVVAIFSLDSFISPLATGEYDKRLQGLRTEIIQRHLVPHEFNHFNNTTIYFDRFDSSGNYVNLFITQRLKNGHSTNIRAETASIFNDDQRSYISLENGYLLRNVDEKPEDNSDTGPSIANFDRLLLYLGVPDSDDEVLASRSSHWTLPQLIQKLDNPAETQTTKSTAIAIINKIMSRPLSTIAAIAIALACFGATLPSRAPTARWTWFGHFQILLLIFTVASAEHLTESKNPIGIPLQWLGPATICAINFALFAWRTGKLPMKSVKQKV